MEVSMNYQNPILRGMYPDPSVCRAGDKYYMVCSTFQYFPGVPVFESEDMVNWRQIGHCLTRESQVYLKGVRSSGGIFAPTIRYNEGRFYMVTTNDSFHENFYVYTDDIYGEWSEPVVVDQDGIDPSLYFEDGHAYFMSNGSDQDGKGCIQMCEIDIETGKKLSDTKILWYGTGGRYLEAPHLYKVGDWYYLLEAEGGTEYGHMVNYSRSKSMWGPFEGYSKNPVLTNRDLGGYQLQGAGHGDIIEDKDGNWWFVHLAFRQIDRWLTYHHLGRETCLQPVSWTEDGWFEIGVDGKALLEIDLPDRNFAKQTLSYKKTFDNTDWDMDWCYLRVPSYENYHKESNMLKLKGTSIDLSQCASPTFLGIRQEELEQVVNCTVTPGEQEAGITFYMDENHHYDIFVCGHEDKVTVSAKVTIGSLSCILDSVTIKGSQAKLRVVSDPIQYTFEVMDGTEYVTLGKADTRYLSSEVAGGFTGVFMGLYAVDKKEQDQWACFEEFTVEHTEKTEDK